MQSQSTGMIKSSMTSPTFLFLAHIRLSFLQKSVFLSIHPSIVISTLAFYGIRSLFSIPELLSHVCMHVKSKGLEQLGLEATEKCLQQYPDHADLKRNLRFFQNRIGKENSGNTTRHVSLELPINNRYYHIKLDVCLRKKQGKIITLSTVHFSVLSNGI